MEKGESLPPNPLPSLCPLPHSLVIPLLVLSGCPRGSLCHRVLSVIHTLISKAFQPAHSCPGGSSKGAAKARQETWWRAGRQASPVFRLVSMRLAARRTFCASSREPLTTVCAYPGATGSHSALEKVSWEKRMSSIFLFCGCVPEMHHGEVSE